MIIVKITITTIINIDVSSLRRDLHIYEVSPRLILNGKDL